VSGTTNRLQAVSPVSSRVAWASGVGGTYAVTTDGGKTWRAAVVPGAEALQFRDVEAVSDRVAYLLAAGVGTDSRIYKTVDGGASWTLQFENQDPSGFYDCFAFFTSRRGITMGDAVNGRLPVLATRDGEGWTDIGDRLPPAQAGEAAFAASGTCVATLGADRAWITTGGAERARVLATTDGGHSWTSHDAPVVHGTPTSGGFSIAFRDHRHGILAGGELATPTERSSANFARSRDGGATWALTTPVPFNGAVFGASYAIRAPGHAHERDGDGPGVLDQQLDDDADADTDASDDGRRDRRSRATVVATGPGGAAWSPDEGDSWLVLDGVANYWAVAFADERTGWLVGTDGRILRIDF
jgi:photosystem II stability/assembly factor-like uncharacterized protein